MQYLTDVPAHRTSTGLDNRKILIWAFLGSDVLFFGTLIATHLVYRGQSVSGPAEGILDIPITTVSTFVLLMSSLAMVLGLSALQRGKMGEARFWIASTALLGSVFIGFQMFEFTEFAKEGLTPRTNLFGSTFLIMTGFHGTHVAIGILWLWSLFFGTFNGKLHQGNALELEIAGLYWHFVDIVWIVIFGVVYLVGAYGAEEHVEEAGHAAAAIFGLG
jgi:heme/copper-type cytochrome/quinol oxidase subunit 3